jgi:hypothetical protein
MQKEITKIVIDGKNIDFSRAVLHVGINNGITYMLTVFSPKGLNGFYQNHDMCIVTREGEERSIVGTLGREKESIAEFYISGGPFPVTEDEFRKYYY